jgi:hypothetical protein
MTTAWQNNCAAISLRHHRQTGLFATMGTAPNQIVFESLLKLLLVIIVRLIPTVGPQRSAQCVRLQIDKHNRQTDKRTIALSGSGHGCFLGRGKGDGCGEFDNGRFLLNCTLPTACILTVNHHRWPGHSILHLFRAASASAVGRRVAKPEFVKHGQQESRLRGGGQAAWPARSNRFRH